MPAATPTKTDSPWTVSTLLTWATEDFTTKEISNPRLEAEILLAHALQTNRVGLYLHFDRPLTSEERERFRNLVLERRKGMPVAYLKNEREFYSHSFYVDSNVLIPRPETELLVDEVLAWAKRTNSSNSRICDVGTGSGAIAISIKKNLPMAIMVGLDREAKALEVARKNSERHDTEIEWVESDLLSSLGDRPFDAIVANLPYVPTKACDDLAVDVRNFEPRSALDGGEDGLVLIDRLIADGAERFPSAVLFLEIGLGQAEEVTQRLRRAGYAFIMVENDLAGIPRIVVAEKETLCR